MTSGKGSPLMFAAQGVMALVIILSAVIHSAQAVPSSIPAFTTPTPASTTRSLPTPPTSKRWPVENIALLVMAVFAALMFRFRRDPGIWLPILALGIMGCVITCGLYRPEDVEALGFHLIRFEDIVVAVLVIAALIARKRGYNVWLPPIFIGAFIISFGWKMFVGYPWPVALAHLMADLFVVTIPVGLMLFALLMPVLFVGFLTGGFRESRR